ncbi:MAG: hypothetical protein WBG32_12950, partial [Nodosilinea sp.]
AIRPDMSLQQILGQLLDQMGIKTMSRQIRQDGKACRLYQVDQTSKAQALDILARRSERRKATEERYALPVTPPPINVDNSGGCYTQKPPETDNLWVGLLVRWGASLGSWGVLATDGDMATIQLQNPIVQTVLTVPLVDLAVLDVAV